MKLDIKTASAVRKNVQDKLTLMYNRIKTTTSDFEINPAYLETELKLAYKQEDDHHLSSPNKSLANNSVVSEDHIPTYKYVSFKNPKDKFKRGVKKAIIMKQIDKVISDYDVNRYLESHSSVRDNTSVQKKRSTRSLK